jgi:hypothetical protein
MDGPALVLDLPAPLSVNKTRRIDYRSMPAVKEWRRKADALFLLQKRDLLTGQTITGPFEVFVKNSARFRHWRQSLQFVFDQIEAEQAKSCRRKPPSGAGSRSFLKRQPCPSVGPTTAPQSRPP